MLPATVAATVYDVSYASLFALLKKAGTMASRTGYALFVEEMVPQLRSEGVPEDSIHRTLGFRWRDMMPEEKASYNSKASQWNAENGEKDRR